MEHGIDRSHLNSKVALSELAAQGNKFCWFKGTQSNTFVDPTFNASWQEAKEIEGFARGVYHFFNPQVDGVVQAKHYLSLGVDFSGAGCLPPWIDVEDLTGATEDEAAHLNKWVADNWQLCLQRLNDFLAYVKEQTGRVCGIYTYNNYMREYYHGTRFTDNPMWLSSLQPNCPVRYDSWEQPIFWQNTYNWNGTDMDGDYFTGTQVDLNALANIVTI